MVAESLNDGVRIAELLASELTGRQVGAFADVSVENADLDVEPTADGARAYDVERADERVARVFVHSERAHVEFETGLDAARAAATERGLRTRPKAVEPPRLLVFVEDAAEVKRVVDAFDAAL
ncbi:hypothetical protein [Salarchaeum japonicum]|uniref:DUF7993 domain-containing protein n=1 Tax=Salarchaeum japonicum TaxID=555573 RepID=A0AAV3SZS2_9EURY|nr:hypothetical protein [Salarchaeum japonicum]